MLLSCSPNTHFHPLSAPTAHAADEPTTRVIFEKISTRRLAEILTAVQRLPALDGFVLTFAQKTKGGICVGREDGDQVQIIEGVLTDLWPFMVDDSLASGLSDEILLFDLSIPTISELVMCDGLGPELQAVAGLLLEHVRDYCLLGCVRK
jgi:hypothetical protein